MFPESEFQELPCPLCAAHNYRPVYSVADRLQPASDRLTVQPQERTFQIVACSSCGFLYLNPRPRAELLPSYYNRAGYDPHQNTGGGIFGSLFRLSKHFTNRWKLAHLDVAGRAGKLLDVGCGTGEFLTYMRTRGWQTLGVEQDAAAAQKAQATGLSVLIGDPAQVTLPRAEFDLITLWHVLEHLPDLSGALQTISVSLKPKARLALALPNPESCDARFYKARWAAWDAPRHLYHFRAQDVSRLLEPYGFRLLKHWGMPLDPFYHALLSELSWKSGWSAKLAIPRAVGIGVWSFLRGLKSGKASSILYLFEKNEEP